MCSQLAPARQKSVFRRGASSSQSVLGLSSALQTTCKTSIRLLSKSSLFQAKPASITQVWIVVNTPQRKNSIKLAQRHSGERKYWSRSSETAAKAGTTPFFCYKSAATGNWRYQKLGQRSILKKQPGVGRASKSFTALACPNLAAKGALKSRPETYFDTQLGRFKVSN